MKCLLVSYIVILAYAVSVKTSFSSEKQEEFYIPYDVTDAVREINRLVIPESRGEIFSKPVGMQFRDRWRLWNTDSRLSQYFYDKGVYNADLMWQIIANASEANWTERTFDFRAELRRILSEYGSWTNIPKDLGSIPAKAAKLRISHYIQRDDLSVIHVFSTAEGVPQWTYIRHVGWSRLESEQNGLIEKSSAIVVPHLLGSPTSSEDQNGSPDPFGTGR